jgi:two-component system, NarL family, sensor histidine kinase UhpB
VGLEARVSSGDPERLAEIEQQLKAVLDARDLAEHKLRISEGRFQSLADASPIGIFRTNKKGQAVYANRRWHEIVGMQPENSRDGGWINGVHPDDRESVLRDWAESTENALPFKRDYRFQDKEGRVIWVRADAVVQRGHDGVATGYIGTVTDITASLLVEEASRADAARFQALSSRILETQEAERRHIAHELHDEVGQALTAIKISMRSLARHIPTAHRSTLDQAMTTTDGTLAMVRGLTLDLRPPQLDHLGLVAALAWHVETRSDMSGLQGHFSADPQIERLRPDIETICFRIAQEATTNVTRHANAQNLWVELQLLGVALVLIIRDDGVGFDIAEGQRRALHGGSLGLLGMEERAAQVGGHFEIESRKHSGTTVRAIFPVVWAKPRTRAEQRE